MTETEFSTREKILFAALTCFSQHGIQATSVNDVAYQAGVTRVTVYRYFPGKRELAQAAFLRVERIFQEGLAELKSSPHPDWWGVMNRIGEGLSKLPPTDAFARADELKRIYPDVYNTVQAVRVATLDGIFDRFFSDARQRDLLRPGLKKPLVKAIFWELIINFFDNPRFSSFGMTDVELFRSMTDILLYGVFKSEPVAS